METQAKALIVEKYQRFAGDTGSPEVQVALLSSRIDNLTTHLKSNKGDKHSHRGLMRMVARRRKLLDYLKRVNPNGYKSLIESLGIRR